MGRKFYKKPHNWRWQKFYTLKNSKVSLADGLEEYKKDQLGYDYDGYWNFLRDPQANIHHFIPGYHCCEDCYYNEIMGTPDDICEYNYQRLYEKVVNDDRTLENLNVGNRLQPPFEAGLEELEGSIIPGNHIEERLEKHLRNLDNLELTMDLNVEKLRIAIGDVSNIEIIKNAVGKKHGEFVAKWACLLSPFWLRSPQTWTKDSRKHILNHVFTLYDVPNVFFQQWLPNEQYRQWAIPIKWICWYIIIGQGGSLKKASKLFGWNISNKFQHFLLDVPNITYPMELCLYAEVHRLGGNLQDFTRLMYSRALVIDPTEQNYDTSYPLFWKSTVLWLIRNREAIRDEESSLIVDWALHSYTESTRNRDGRYFSWKGRTVTNVVALSQHYATQLAMPSWIGYEWKAHGWNWSFADGSEDSWEFAELTNGRQLYEEGRYMQHCVGGYSGRCASGTSAIFSLKRNGNRVITIEVNPKSCTLIQSLGKGNRSPKKEETKVIRLWMTNINEQHSKV